MAYQMCREYHSWMYEKWPGLFRDLSKQRICKDTLKQRICRGISQDSYFVGPIFFLLLKDQSFINPMKFLMVRCKFF